MEETQIRIEVRGARDIESAVKIGLSALSAGTAAIVEQRRPDGSRVDGRDRQGDLR